MRYWILDEAGKPMIAASLAQWSRWAEVNLGEGNAVATDDVDDMVISTVFLAIDHGFTRKPVLWETMVFGGALDRECRRYTSKADAIRGHVEMVATAFAVSKRLKGVEALHQGSDQGQKPR